MDSQYSFWWLRHNLHLSFSPLGPCFQFHSLLVCLTLWPPLLLSHRWLPISTKPGSQSWSPIPSHLPHVVPSLPRDVWLPETLLRQHRQVVLWVQEVICSSSVKRCVISSRKHQEVKPGAHVACPNHTKWRRGQSCSQEAHRYSDWALLVTTELPVGMLLLFTQSSQS